MDFATRNQQSTKVIKPTSPVQQIQKKVKEEDEKRKFQEASRNVRQVVQSNDPQLIRSFRGHQGAVNSVDFDPFMRQVVSGGDDGLVYVWNFLPQKRPFKFVGHKGAVLDVHFSPDGESIISAGQDRQIRIWKNSVQAKSRIVKGHGGAVRNIHFSNDGKLMLSSSDDKTMKVWNFDSGKFLHSLPGHKNWVRQGQFSPDMRLICSASDDKTVNLWDFNTQKICHTFYDHNAPVYTAKFSPDGTCIASGGQDRNVKIFDIRSEKIIQHYDAHDQAVNKVNFHQSGYYLSSVSKDSQIKIWDLRMGRIGWTLYSHKDDCRGFNFNPRGDYFVSGGADNLVMVWASNIDEDNSNFPRSFDPVSLEQGNTKNIFKSNKIPLNKRDENIPGIKYQGQENIGKQKLPRPPAKHQEEEQADFYQNQQKSRLSELLSVNLEQIVNQLDIVTTQLNQLDQRLSQNEENVRLLLENDKVVRIVQRYESENNSGEKVDDQFNAWESYKDNKGFETGQFRKQDFKPEDFGEEQEEEQEEQDYGENQDRNEQFDRRPQGGQENWENEVPEREDFLEDEEESKNPKFRSNQIDYEQSFGNNKLASRIDDPAQVSNVFTQALLNTRDVDDLNQGSNREEIDPQDLELRDEGAEDLQDV